MYNLQGLITKNISNASSMFERLSYVGTNFANYNTNGYKNIRFEQILSDDGLVNGVKRTDYTQGGMKLTGNQYDVALKEEGFIPVVSQVPVGQDFPSLLL